MLKLVTNPSRERAVGSAHSGSKVGVALAAKRRRGQRNLFATQTPNIKTLEHVVASLSAPDLVSSIAAFLSTADFKQYSCVTGIGIEPSIHTDGATKASARAVLRRLLALRLRAHMRCDTASKGSAWFELLQAAAMVGARIFAAQNNCDALASLIALFSDIQIVALVLLQSMPTSNSMSGFVTQCVAKTTSSMLMRYFEPTPRQFICEGTDSVTSRATVSLLLLSPPGCIADCARQLVDYTTNYVVSKSETESLSRESALQVLLALLHGGFGTSTPTTVGTTCIGAWIRSLAKSLLSRAAERTVSSSEAHVLGAVLERDPRVDFVFGSEIGVKKPFESASQVKTTIMRSCDHAWAAWVLQNEAIMWRGLIAGMVPLCTL